MKDINLKKILKNEAETHTPNIYKKVVSIAEKEGLFSQESAEYAGTNAVAVAKRKLFIPVVAMGAFLLAVAILFSVLLPAFNLNLPPVIPSAPFDITLSTKDVYGMGAVSSAKLLNGQSVQMRTFANKKARNNTHAPIGNLSNDNQSLLTTADVQKFHRYFLAMDDMWSEKIIDTAVSVNTDADYAEYSVKMLISGCDFFGNNISYVMYYSESLYVEDAEDKSDVNFKEDEKRNEDGEEEICYILQGVLIMDEAKYYLEGSRTQEKDDEESEEELEIRVFQNTSDKGSYVEMKQEYSEEDGEIEKKFVYKIYSNGQLKESASLKFEYENQNDENEMSYKLEFKTDGVTQTYKFKRDFEEDKPDVVVRYKKGSQSENFTITENITDGKTLYEYIFSNGTSLTF